MDTAMLSELFGGVDRYKALQCLFEHPDRTFGPRELAAQAGIDPGNASRWLRRWSDSGLLEKSQSMRYPRYAASRDPALEPLGMLMRQGSSLVAKLRDAVHKLGDDVVAAAVFGSVARGENRPESDIDVLLITTLPQLRARSAFKALSRELGRQIDVQAFAPTDWKDALASGDPLVLTIANGKRIALKGDIDVT